MEEHFFRNVLSGKLGKNHGTSNQKSKLPKIDVLPLSYRLVVLGASWH